MKAKEYYLAKGNALKNTIESQMFGKPCFKINKKAFVCFYEKEMVFKLKLHSDIHQEAMSLDGSSLFDPSKKNRAMKEWVQVPFEYKNLWEKFSHQAYNYVKSL